MRILVAVSDLPLSISLDREFRAENYAVDVASAAVEVKSLARDRHYDAAILDLHLLKSDGLQPQEHQESWISKLYHTIVPS